MWAGRAAELGGLCAWALLALACSKREPAESMPNPAASIVAEPGSGSQDAGSAATPEARAPAPPPAITSAPSAAARPQPALHEKLTVEQAYAPLFELGHTFRYALNKRTTTVFFSESLQRHRDEDTLFKEELSCKITHVAQSETALWSQLTCSTDSPGKWQTEKAEPLAKDEVLSGSGQLEEGRAQLEGVYVLNAEQLRFYDAPFPRSLDELEEKEARQSYPAKLVNVDQQEEGSEYRVQRMWGDQWCITDGSYGCFEITHSICFQDDAGIESIQYNFLGNPGSSEIRYRLISE